MYKIFIRPILFLFSAEKAHHFTFRMLRWSAKIPGIKALRRAQFDFHNPQLEKEVFGLKFKNPVGLAAGFDKNAILLNELEDFGFGFIEIGTVTPKPQPGNPKPRLFRLVKDEAIINRMGFNNDGADVIADRLSKRRSKILIGGNIGKNTATGDDGAKQDYMYDFSALHPYVDYFVVNVSCPNVGSLAKLQNKDFLVDLLNSLKKKNEELGKQKPILLKIAPDLNSIQLDEVIEIIRETKIAGVVATNTSTSREGLNTSQEKVSEIGNGGLSGKPVKQRSTEVIRYLSEKSNKAFPIIGVGGIHSPTDAIEKMRAGADLVQIYTGFIYEGPSIIKKINKALLHEKH
ncbi:MAG: quinone-dependent dihydroorotate dehydrogenase [Crocinitomicaceae bacterium]|nr:quinone-dependent dihydroorotate dehydrogenase [Crocinitomicaceae bacterium]MBK8924693.1 quinone-dependent dihydroorotate dehydrogenase [Crocinitomicaceae bacterium]